MTDPIPALRGATLDQLLDQLEAELAKPGAFAHQAQLIAQLRAQTMQADSLVQLERLWRLWLRVGDKIGALELIDQYSADLLTNTAPAAVPRLHMHLCILKLRSLDESAELPALLEMTALVPRLNASDVEHYRKRVRPWFHFDFMPTQQALAALDLCRALDRALHDRESFRACDEAEYHAQRARVLWRSEQHPQAIDAARRATNELARASSDQVVEADDWLMLGERMIDIDPDSIALIQIGLQRATADWALPRRREAEIRLARLSARAWYAKGELARALSVSSHARYSLAAHGGDDFNDYELRWLIEAGRDDEAGERAFRFLYEMKEMSPGTVEVNKVAKIVHECLADPAQTSAWWWLCALRAATSIQTLGCFLDPLGGDQTTWRAYSPQHRQLYAAEMRERWQHDDAQKAFATARAMTEARWPQHPWLARLAIEQDWCNGKLDAATAAAQLEALAVQAMMHDWRTWYAILQCKIEAKGLAHALRDAIPRLASGRDAYQYACMVEKMMARHLRHQLSGDLSNDADWMRGVNVRVAVYEQGLQHFERYFETGQGHLYDACVRIYAMLCNNLAIDYRQWLDRPDDAQALLERAAAALIDYRHAPDETDKTSSMHAQSIAANPFAEHDGLGVHKLDAATVRYIQYYERIIKHFASNKKMRREVPSHAEQLWQYATPHDHVDLNLDQYVEQIALALRELGRTGEILIWLERLAQWQLDRGEDPLALSDEALMARLTMCLHLSTQTEQAREVWQRLEPQVRASGNYAVLHQAAMAAYQRNDHELAVELFKAALARHPSDTPFEQEQLQLAKAKLTEAEEAAARTGKLH